MARKAREPKGKSTTVNYPKPVQFLTSFCICILIPANKYRSHSSSKKLHFAAESIHIWWKLRKQFTPDYPTQLIYLQYNIYTPGSGTIQEGRQSRKLARSRRPRHLLQGCIFYTLHESCNNETLTVLLPKQDLNNDNTIWHANVDEGNLISQGPILDEALYAIIDCIDP